MSSPTILKAVHNGHLVVVRRRRGYVEATVFPDASEDYEPVDVCKMPNELRYDLEYVAKVAERQTDFENTEGDK